MTERRGKLGLHRYVFCIAGAEFERRLFDWRPGLIGDLV